jgi:transposase
MLEAVWLAGSMKPLTISDPALTVVGLQQEIQRSEDSRYDHRLHGVLLVAQGMTCPEVAGLLGDAPRTVEYWVRRFEEQGLAGLTEGERAGRPSRLSPVQVKAVDRVLRGKPTDAGMQANLWDGKTLAAWIEKQFEIRLGVRQCQRLFRQLGFRLRKPRPMIAKANPSLQKTHKKNSEN